jgi:hypothetical protein
MKQLITKWISALLVLLLSALLCNILYRAFLLELFERDLSYMQWLSICIISNLLFTKNSIPEKKDESKGNKISRDLFKNGIGVV